MELNKNSLLWKFARLTMSDIDTLYYERGYNVLDSCTLVHYLIRSVAFLIATCIIVTCISGMLVLITAYLYALDSGIDSTQVFSNLSSTWWYVVPYGTMILISCAILTVSTIFVLNKTFKLLFNGFKNNSLSVAKEAIIAKLEKTCIRIVLK